MTVIAVDGFPLGMNLIKVSKLLAKSVNGRFETLNFVPSERGNSKTCYLQLSDILDPKEVINRINMMAHRTKKKFLHAYAPDTFPKTAASRKAPPKILRKKLDIARETTLSPVVAAAHLEIMTELQYKYTGLYKLSSGGSHTLLEAIGMTVHDRLWQLVASVGEELCNSFTLTERYRKAHPHFGDFQLILGTLHRLQDAAGAPRTQLLETELTEPSTVVSDIDCVSFVKAKAAVSKYTARIMKKLEEHISSYELTAHPEDSKEEVARKDVQTQLVNMMPYLPSILQQITVNHFTESCCEGEYHRMRMYGEPYLPDERLLRTCLKSFQARGVTRWKSMFNLILFYVRFSSYSKLMKMNGTTLGGSKVVIRSSKAQIYRVAPIRRKMATETVEDEKEADHNME